MSNDAPTGAMVALFPASSEAEALAAAGTESADQIHLTLVYLGKAADFDEAKRTAIEDALAAVAASHTKLTGRVGGSGMFQPGEDGTPVIALPDVKGLSGLRTALMDYLVPEGIKDLTHGWSGHITLGYVQGDPAPPQLEEGPLTFDALSVVWAGERKDFPLNGATLRFAHSPAVRAKAKAALDAGGSIRKAAAAAGVGKSTVHDWVKRGGFDHLDDLAATADEDAEFGSDQTPAVDEQPPEPPPIAPTQWIPDQAHALKAFFRYSNSLLAGARPDFALRAAQKIDPTFALTVEQDTALLEGLSRLMMSEVRLEFASGPPAYVRSVYDQYAMDRAAVDELAGRLRGIMIDAWREGINAQLVALGRDPIATLTDRALLNRISLRAQMDADAIAHTWNRDLATKTGQQWIDLSAVRGNQMSRQWLVESINEWTQARAGWKSDQISISTASRGFNDAVVEFEAQNGTADYARVTPTSGQCLVCQDICAQFADWTPAGDALGSASLPAHPYCVHSWEIEHRTIPATQSLWTGQAAGNEASQTA